MIEGYLYLIDLVRCLLFREEFLNFFARSYSLFPFFLHYLCYYKQTQTINRQYMQIREGGVVSPDIILNLYLTFVLQTTQLRL